MSQAVTELRLRLLANGYTPLPALGKAVLLKGWSGIDVTRATVESKEWESYPSTSIRTGTIVCLDIDIQNREAADAVEALIRERYDGEMLLVRFGQAPKRAVLFRTAQPFRKIARIYGPRNADAKPKLEVLGQGQQVLVFGIHPDTKKPYSWHGGDPLSVPAMQLPEISASNAEQLIEAADRLLCDQFGYEPATTSRTNGHAANGSAASGDYSELLKDAHTGADVNNAQSRRILSLLNRGTHPDEVERIVLSETMASGAWDQLTWTEKKELSQIRPRIRSALKKLNSEYDQTEGQRQTG
jgi:hypothetical protein